MKFKNIVKPEWFCEVYRASSYVQWGDLIIPGTEHNMKLKFSMLTYM